MADEQRIEALTERCEWLEERIVQLEKAMGLGVLTPVEWQLTPAMMRLFGCLMERELMTAEAGMVAMYRDRIGADDEPHVKIIDVQICKMRSRLKPFGLQILTRWGQGYYLTPETKARVRDLMAEAVAA